MFTRDKGNGYAPYANTGREAIPSSFVTARTMEFCDVVDKFSEYGKTYGFELEKNDVFEIFNVVFGETDAERKAEQSENMTEMFGTIFESVRELAEKRFNGANNKGDKFSQMLGEMATSEFMTRLSDAFAGNDDENAVEDVADTESKPEPAAVAENE